MLRQGYWTQKAERWVSIFALCGFMAIAGALVYSALQANVLGSNLSSVRSGYQSDL